MTEIPQEKSGRPKNRTALRSQIDENLRRAYDEVLTEAVPDRFAELLARLQAEPGPGAGAARPADRPADSADAGQQDAALQEAGPQEIREIRAQNQAQNQAQSSDAPLAQREGRPE